MNLEKTITENYENVSCLDSLENKNKKSFTITTLLDVFECWLDYISVITGRDLRTVSECMQKKNILNSFSYTKKDIKEFSVAMSLYETHHDFENAGIFLSYLIYQHWKKNSINGFSEKTELEKKWKRDESDVVNEADEADGSYTIITEHLQTQIGHIGYRNSGVHIHIVGNAGRNLGTEMNDGSIYLTGNADFLAGSFMKGGKISITDSQKGACFGMKGGEFHIRGDAHSNIGIQMNGGSIQIDGKIATDLSLDKTYAKIRSLIERGCVYHQGKLIVCKLADHEICE